MNLGDILKTVGTGLIASIAGPAAPLIIGGLNAILPSDKQLPDNATGEQAQGAIDSLPPEQRAIALKQEYDFEIKMEELAVETFKEEVKDKGNAREHNKSSHMPAILSFMLTMFIVGIVTALFMTEPPAGAREVLFMLLGVVIKEWSNSMHYWYGTTRSSQDKTRLLK